MKFNNKGFTLLELLVVIAIIGLLSTIAVTSLNSARVKARDTKRLGDMKAIQTAQEFYFDENNTYGCLVKGAVSACSDLDNYMNLDTVKDGRWADGDKCTNTTVVAGYAVTDCDYAFAVPNAGEGYKVVFYLEGASSAGNTAATLCGVTAQGLQCPVVAYVAP